MALRRAEDELFARQEYEQRLRDGEVRLGEVPSALSTDVPTASAPGTPATVPGTTPTRDLSWLEGITLPDLPLRWDERVIRYLEYFRSDRHGRNHMAGWLRRSTRYGAMIDQELREASLPRDLRCVAMAESGFDPTVRSFAGAAGMWQFIERTGDQYGLTRDHWVDRRMDPIRSTHAAAEYLGSLHRRLGSWELALAAYNMGYGALLRSIRKYNTNDFWALANVESGLPFETTIYVSKILACAVVMRNPERFGFEELTRDAPIEVQEFEVGGGVPLRVIARAARMPVTELRALNPELLRGRTPPGGDYPIRIPVSRAERFTRGWARVRPGDRTFATHVVRFGESLDDVAWSFRTSASNLRQLNDLERGERVSAGLVLVVPTGTRRERPRAEAPEVVGVPPGTAPSDGERRVFYRVRSRDRLDEIAHFFEVRPEDLRSWNALDADATLVSGMILQLFVPEDRDLSQVMVVTPDEVRVLVVGSEEFFDYHETQNGRVRFRYTVQPGDTLGRLGRRFGTRAANLARINGISRRTRLTPGQEIIIYAEPQRVPAEYLPASDTTEGSETSSPTPESESATTPATGSAGETTPETTEVPETAPASVSETESASEADGA